MRRCFHSSTVLVVAALIASVPTTWTLRASAQTSAGTDAATTSAAPSATGPGPGAPRLPNPVPGKLPPGVPETSTPAARDAASTVPSLETLIPPGQPIGLPDAIKLARTRGFDVLLANAAARGAEANVRAAGPLPNPTVSAYVGRVFNYSPNVPGCEGCSRTSVFAELSDEGLIEGAITRKRALREAVAKRALDAARLGRSDAERLIVAQAKIQYLQTAAARVRLEFAREFATSLERAVEVNRVRYPRVIDEGQLARVEQEAMRAVQEVERARRQYRQEQIDLAMLLGMSGPIPELDVDRDVLRFRVPEGMQNLDRTALLRMAIENRPDRKQAVAREAQGDAAVTLAKRERFPDVSLMVQYQQIGTGQSAVQPPTLAVGVGLPLPLFYQRQGEVGRAEADREAAVVERRRLDTTVASDIEAAYNAFTTARSIVERYESALLERAKRAREITLVQFTAGSATLTDLLDAQRSWVLANSDHNVELVNYWTAVFLLEQAVGKELVP